MECICITPQLLELNICIDQTSDVFIEVNVMEES